MRPNEIVEILIQADRPVCARGLIEVSVHLPTRGTRWVAAFRDETGRKVWRSTGLRDRKTAMAVAREWEADAKRKRVAQGAPPPRLTIRVRPGSTCLSPAILILIQVSYAWHGPGQFGPAAR
jgi:hypothetical protein